MGLKRAEALRKPLGFLSQSMINEGVWESLGGRTRLLGR